MPKVTIAQRDNYVYCIVKNQVLLSFIYSIIC